jgi:hypothetical protein
MKKTLALLPLLLLAMACEPANREPADNSANPPQAASLSEADMIAQEQAAWDSLKNKDKDPEAFGNLRADEYTEVTANGVVYDKASVIASLKDVNVTDVTLSDLKTLPIDKDAFIVAYTVSRTGTFNGFPFPPGSYRASTVWANHDGKWLAVYHQETPVAPPGQAPPPPAADQSVPPAP